MFDNLNTPVRLEELYLPVECIRSVAQRSGRTDYRSVVTIGPSVDD